MLFRSVIQAALVATALAQPVQHQHHQHEKKDVVTQTVVVTANGVSGAVPTSSVLTSSVAASAADSGTASAASSVSSPVSSSGSSNFSGAVKGVTYSPYTASGGCKSASQVFSEIQRLSDYEVIRLYGVDCDQVQNVLAAMSSEQKLFAGIYFMNAIEDGVSTLASAVKAANGWSQVITVSIGNELVNSGQATVSQVQQYVNTGRAALTSAGYTGDVVSVDTFIAIYENEGLCEISDYVAANAHAYFDGGVVAADAGEWVAKQYEGLKSACSKDKVLIVESGWPSQGDTNGVAIAGSSEQTSALESIASQCSDYVFYFNAYNDLWKAPGNLNCEKYWGILSS